jgi:hypothetical protein
VLTEMGIVLTTKAFVPTEMEERANHANFCGERANRDGGAC